MKDRNKLEIELKDVQDSLKKLRDKIQKCKSHKPYIAEYNALINRERNILINLNQLNMRRIKSDL